MWNHRMFLFSGHAKYIDVLERTLYNALISGVSLSGDRFFYPNPLESRGQHKRSPWFGCACCPGNITRFIASVPGYIYARRGDTAYVNLFVDSSTKIKIDKYTVGIKQQTEYPWEGKVKIAVEPERSAEFRIAVRIPGWARNEPVPSDLYRYMDGSTNKISLKVNGKRIEADREGWFVCIERRWKKGDVIEINFGMPVRRVVSHGKITDNKGKVALQRGPIVYCAEWPDNDGHVMNLVLADNAKLTTEHHKDMLNGVTVIKSKAVALSYDKDGKTVLKKEQDFTAIPYYAWAHRGPGEMSVWLARDDSAAKPATPAGIIRNSSFEEAANNNPTGWERRTYSGRGKSDYVEGGRTDKRAVMLSSESGADIGWLTSVPVKPRSKYKLTGWIKTENVETSSGKGALLNLHNIQPSQTQAITGTKDWTKVEVVFDTGERAAVEINCLFGGWGLAKGKAWYDDVQLELLSTKTTKLSVTIDAGKTGEPISKYIYGQFIEHLGRCIYGGIWAEMLEDRKFYYPITANYDPYRAASGTSKDNPFAIVKASPWQIIGDKNAVKMNKRWVFVGEHTPQIILPGNKPCGIAQENLGLIKDKEYTGRIILAAVVEALPIKVSLAWGNGKDERHTVTLDQGISRSYGFTKFPLNFKSGATTNNGRLEIVGLGKKEFSIGTVSLMPADNIEGMRADTLKVLKELNAPLYRWPGGNFVSGYDWRDGIGERDKRPPRTNPAWTGVEHNDFGFHEFIRFCRLVDAEPLVTVNTGFGDAYSAAAQLEYSNGGTDTLMGALRAKNGDPKPFDVRYWCIGNEMFGSWQLGYMRLEHYVLKHNWVVDKMREVDPDIVPIASGNAGSWSEGLLRRCSNHIDMIAEHFYCRDRKDMLEHTSQIPDNIKRKVQFHRELREKLDTLKGKDIQIAMTEWNYWYGPHVFGELGTRYFHKDGLGIARGLHEYFRHSDIMFMANYAQTVNVIGCIKASKTAAALETTGLVLKLYREHFGTIPVDITGDAYPLDISAAWTSDRKALTLAVVNPTENELELPMELKGAELPSKARLLQIAHPDPMAYNEPGKEPNVTIKEKTGFKISRKLSVPALSINLYKLAIKD
jgi:alpha-N-arabinofuranosidase